MPEIVAGAMAIAALLLFRHYAARQVIARRGRFVWVFAFPMVIGPSLLVWVGLRLLISGQLLGGALLVFGVALGTVELGFFRRASHVVSTTPLGQDVTDALVEPTADFMMVATVGGLIFALIMGFALVAWAILGQGPGS